MWADCSALSTTARPGGVRAESDHRGTRPFAECWRRTNVATSQESSEAAMRAPVVRRNVWAVLPTHRFAAAHLESDIPAPAPRSQVLSPPQGGDELDTRRGERVRHRLLEEQPPEPPESCPLEPRLALLAVRTSCSPSETGRRPRMLRRRFLTRFALLVCGHTARGTGPHGSADRGSAPGWG